MAPNALPSSPVTPGGTRALADQGARYRPALGALAALFFAVGFITCLNDILIPHLKALFALGYTEASFVQVAFFVAYFALALPAGRLIERVGYQRGIVMSLAVAGAGAMLFYAAASALLYPLFLLALFVLASGFALLQVAANPYVAVLGPASSASSRLALVQAFNSLGTTIAPWFGGLLILARGGLGEGAPGSAALTPSARQAAAAAVKAPYVGLALALFSLAVVVARLTLPAIPAGESGRRARVRDALRVRHLRLGVIGIFAYVGAEVAIGSFLVSFLGLRDTTALAAATAARYVSYYWGGAMVGRFVGTLVLGRFPPGRVLGVFAVAAFALVGTAVFTTGTPAAGALLAVGLFNSIMFPTIFTLAIRDLGPLTAQGSAALISAIVGGALVPLAVGTLADAIGLHRALALPLACYAYIAFYGVRGSRAVG